MNYIKKVKEFHEQFEAPIKSTPQIPKDRKKLRLSLLKEELKELEEAIRDNDLVGVLDAFCDLQYVLSGAILEFGMHEIFEGAFQEVHFSNMSKACSNKRDVSLTVEKYLDENIDVKVKPVGSKYVILRKKDNKVLKNINYRPANLKPFITLSKDVSDSER